MTENPTYTHTITQTITLKDVYGEWATVTNLTPKGYEVVGFRPPNKGELFVYTFMADYEVLTATSDTSSNNPRLIVKKLLEPIKFNPNIFGEDIAILYNCKELTIPSGYTVAKVGNVWEARESERAIDYITHRLSTKVDGTKVYIWVRPIF